MKYLIYQHPIYNQFYTMVLSTKRRMQVNASGNIVRILETHHCSNKRRITGCML